MLSIWSNMGLFFLISIYIPQQQHENEQDMVEQTRMGLLRDPNKYKNGVNGGGMQ